MCVKNVGFSRLFILSISKPLCGSHFITVDGGKAL